MLTCDAEGALLQVGANSSLPCYSNSPVVFAEQWFGEFLGNFREKFQVNAMVIREE